MSVSIIKLKHLLPPQSKTFFSTKMCVGSGNAEYVDISPQLKIRQEIASSK